MTADDRRPGPAVSATADTDPGTIRLERWKRASLRDLALRSAWQLGALARRVEREAPEFHARLRVAIEVVHLLCGRLSVDDRGEPERPRRPGQGELF